MRTHIIVHILQSIDGRVAGKFFSQVSEQVSAYAAELQAWCGRQGLGLRYTARRFGARKRKAPRLPMRRRPCAIRKRRS